MIVTSPLFGTGFGGFVQHLDSTREREIVRFVQPVHHVGLLWLVETGIIWNVAVCGVLFFLFRKHRRRAAEYMQRGGAILLILSPLLALDHYLLTNPGASLIAITWAMVMVTVQEKSVTKETA
jgi:O-antigen ligase